MDKEVRVNINAGNRKQTRRTVPLTMNSNQDNNIQSNDDSQYLDSENFGDGVGETAAECYMPQIP